MNRVVSRQKGRANMPRRVGNGSARREGARAAVSTAGRGTSSTVKCSPPVDAAACSTATARSSVAEKKPGSLSVGAPGGSAASSSGGS